MTRMATYALLAAAICGGCGREGLDLGPPGDYIKPTIAVMKFENRAPFQLGWNLGAGTSDILVDRLVATGRYHVVERPELNSVLHELAFQNSGATRDEDRAVRGRLKNVNYLIKGTVTDFGHVSAGGGSFSGFGWDVFGRGNRAVVSMTLYVVDVESGEIICSQSVEQSVRAGDVAVKATYSGVAFGGSVFYRTPLGRATAKVIDKAVDRITRAIAARPWAPRIAAVQGDGLVIINGGWNHGVRTGWEYEVLEAGEPVHDPDTGDVIANQAGECLGRVRVTAVHDRHCLASVVAGKAADFKVGQRCRRAASQVAASTP